MSQEMPDEAAGGRRVYVRPVCRGVMLFLGVFTLLSVVGGVWSPGFDANIWWIDLRTLPVWLARGLLTVFSGVLLWYAAVRWAPRWLRAGGAAVAGVFACVAFANCWGFYWQMVQGRGVRPGVWVPFSLVSVIALVMVAVGFAPPPKSKARWPRVVCAATVAVCAVGFPLAQMFFFGRTDYRRAADVAVVFGALAHADGSPSDALADRLRTACELHRQGLVRKLIMSGGPGGGAVHETEAMRRFAVAQGVREEDIVLDAGGVNTAASVAGTGAILDRMEARRVLAVSHFYHLPRIKLAYAAAGREVYTVPARESYTLTKMPYFMAREVAALWVYYVRAVLP